MQALQTLTEAEEIKKIFNGKYEAEIVLGGGSSGKVYKVWDRHLGKYMAVKQYAEENKNGFSEWEMQILKSLKHPALPMITDYLKTETASYLVMEYVEGISLRSYLQEKDCVRQEQAVEWILEITNVLTYLHRRNPPVFYRDIKPDNILLDREGRIHLIDFGAACIGYCKNEGGAVNAGTFGYAAPEQFQTEKETMIDERCDIYGLGIVFHQMLTGKNPALPPYRLQPIRSYNRTLSYKIEKIIKRATERDKEKRYSSVMKMEEDIKRYKSGRHIRYIGRIWTVFIYYLLLAILFGLFWKKADTTFAGRTEADLEILLLAGGILVLCTVKLVWEKLKQYRTGGIKLERNVYLSDKKEKGLAMAICGMIGAAVLAGGKTPDSLAAEDMLHVTVRNEYGQKLLIRYDAVYSPKGDIRLEIPLKEMEAGEEYILKMECREVKSGTLKSRILRLKLPE